MATTTTHTATATTTEHPQPQMIPTQDSSFVPSGPVTASLHFYEPAPDGSKPFNYVETPPPGEPQRNYGSVTHSVPIQDMRGHESEFTLDRHAFSALSDVPSTTTAATFAPDNDSAVQSTYYPEVESLLLHRIPGHPKRVLIFDHTIRRTSPSAPRGPVARTHIDQTPASAIARVRHHLPPQEADSILRDNVRVRLINVWRPLNLSPVQSHPLAVADSTTVKDTDLVGIEHRYPDRTGETAAVQYDQTQKWWYWSGMDGGMRANANANDSSGEIGEGKGKGGERLLLQCYDSWEEGKAPQEKGGLEVGRHGARVPHTAFEDPRTPLGAEGRESIEVRALVFG